MKCNSSLIFKSNNKSYKKNDKLKNYYFQKYPIKGILNKNLNKDLKDIVRILNNEKPNLIYSYVLTSVSNDKESFLQTGNAPNFQGDHITLCTCMHHMRCFIDNSLWENNVWLAGITGKNFSDNGNYLYYLMKISRSYLSQYDLWNSKSLSDRDRKEKSSLSNYLGDLYEPKKKNLKNKIDPKNYKSPINGHCHHRDKSDNKWEYDINYFHNTYKRSQSFLLGDPFNSYIWEKPKIKINYLNEENKITNHPRTRRYIDFNSLIKYLQ